MNHKKNVLTIAGSDSSGGAGIQADLKVFEALNVYGASVITSVTAQNTLGVQEVYDLPALFIEGQLKSVLSDIHFDAIKIGMLKCASYIEPLAKMIRQYRTPFIVLDPVMISSSGHRLIDSDTANFVQTHIFPLISLLTPNIPEASFLLNKDENWVSNNANEAAKALLKNYDLKAVLLKGGHTKSALCLDTLAVKESQEINITTYKYKRINSSNTHGTGCTLSSAIAAYFARGNSLIEATTLAGKYLHTTLLNADRQQVGSGRGPLNHNIGNFKI